MKQAVHRLLVVACALHLSGAHWAVLQMAAWTGMLVKRAQVTGVAEAIQTTFDGRHPCAMCAAIESGQKEEQKEESGDFALKELSQIKLVAMEIAALPHPSEAGELHWRAFAATAGWRTDAPPTPPPLA